MPDSQNFGNIAYMISLTGKCILTLLHSEWPKLYRVLAILSAMGLNTGSNREDTDKLVHLSSLINIAHRMAKTPNFFRVLAILSAVGLNFLCKHNKSGQI